MSFSIFFQTFYLVLLVLLVVGPGFLTIANIAMTRGYKTGYCAVSGCFIGDCILISLGVVMAKEAVKNLPQQAKFALTILAGLCFLFLAIKFWRSDVTKYNPKVLDKKDGLSLALSLFLLKMSSPISIVGYGVIFSRIVNSEHYVLSAIFGGCCASLVVNILMILTFATIGKKIKLSLLAKLNKVCAICILFFALLTFFG